MRHFLRILQILITLLLFVSAGGCQDESTSVQLEQSVLDIGREIEKSPMDEWAAQTAPEQIWPIVLLADTSGENATQGIMVMQAASLAVAEVNAYGGAGGRPFKLIVLDMKSSTEETEQNPLYAYLATLGEDELPLVILGPHQNRQVELLTRAAPPADIPLLFGSSGRLPYYNRAWRLLRMRPSDDVFISAMAYMAAERLQADEVIFLNTNTSEGFINQTLFRQTIAAYDPIRVTTFSYTPGAEDYILLTSQIRYWRAETSDVVIIDGTDPGDLALLTYTLIQSGWKKPILVAPPGSRLPFYAQIGTLSYDIYAVTDTLLKGDSRSEAFSERFERRYGIAPDPTTVWAYDAVWMTARAIEQAQGDREQFWEILRQMQYVGVVGPYTYQGGPDGLFWAAIGHLEGGTLEPVGYYHLERQEE